MGNKLWVLILAGALVLTLISGLVPVIGEDEIVIEAEVYDALEVGESVNVLIQLKEVEIDDTSLDTVRESIREYKRSVLELLDEEDLKIKYDYELVNSIAGELSASGLEKLKNHQKIREIHVEKIFNLHLDESVPLINADDVHATQDDNSLFVRGSGQTVCFLDTGIDYTHPDLGGCFGEGCKVIGGYDFVDDDGDPMDVDGHGTHVAGIVGSDGVLNGIGVAPDANLVAARVCHDYDGDGNGDCYESDVIAGASWCVSNMELFNVKVISASLGFEPFLFCPSFIDGAIDLAYGQGIPFVASSGNSGDINELDYPACSPNSISVGATYDENVGPKNYEGICVDDTTEVDQVACFSNSDEDLDLLAPGAMIFSSLPGNGGGNWWGTSMAAPHVAGTIALINQVSSDLSVDEILTAMKDTGVPVYDERNEFTFPRIDTLGAVNSFVEGCVVPISSMQLTEDTILCPGTYILSSGINIGANNVELDCNGATLIGTSAYSVIHNSRYDYAVIKNCNIESPNNLGSGVSLGFIGGCGPGFNTVDAARYNIIENNVFTNLDKGVSVNGYDFDYCGVGFSSTIRNNVMKYNGVGINVDEALFHTIYDNIITHNYDGIFLDYPGSTGIYFNDISENTHYNLRADDSFTTTAEHNWWGSITPEVIDAGIYDDNENANYNLVDFEPFFLGKPPFRDDFTIDLNLYLEGIPKGPRTLGLGLTASDLYDVEFDEVAPPAEPTGFNAYFLEQESAPNDKLSLDVKQISNYYKNWILIVTAPAQQEVEFSWDDLELPENVDLALVEVDPELTSLGTRVDFDSQSSVSFTGGLFAPVTKIFLIGTTARIEFEPGWNFVSMPVEPVESIENIFDGNILGSVFGWNGLAYTVADDLDVKNAYWVAVENSFVTDVLGVPALEHGIAMTPVWNMVGPVAPVALPLSGVAGAIWTWEYNQYVVEDELMSPEIGYWVPVTGDIVLPEGEISAGNEFDYFVDLNVELDDNLMNVRTYGMDGDATDGFDSGIDDLVPPPSPESSFDNYFYEALESPPLDRLSVNVKEMDGEGDWIYVVIAPVEQTVDVSWDSSLFDGGMNVIMQELDAVTGEPIGAEIDMRETSSVSVIGGGIVPTVGVYQLTMFVVESCFGDVNGDGIVNTADLILLILAWHTDDIDADIDGSGFVDVSDLVDLILEWGPCGASESASGIPLEAAELIEQFDEDVYKEFIRDYSIATRQSLRLN